MRIFAKAAAAAALALTLGACTTSLVSQPADIPGFNEQFTEEVGDLFVRSDMVLGSGFADAVCDNAADFTNDSSFVLKISSGGGGSGSGDPGNTGSGSGQKAAGPFSVALELRPAGDSKGPKDAKGQPVDPTEIKVCALKVLATAVNVCVYKTLNRNALDRALNLGIGEVIAVAGTAATIGSLSHTTGTNLGWITGGAAVLTALAQTGQKSLQSPASAQIPAIVNAGLSYLVLDNPTGSDKTAKLSYGHLFDAAISQCAIYTQ